MLHKYAHQTLYIYILYYVDIRWCPIIGDENEKKVKETTNKSANARLAHYSTLHTRLTGLLRRHWCSLKRLTRWTWCYFSVRRSRHVSHRYLNNGRSSQSRFWCAQFKRVSLVGFWLHVRSPASEYISILINYCYYIYTFDRFILFLSLVCRFSRLCS